MKTFHYFFIACFLLLSGLELAGQNLHTRQAPLPCLNKKFSIVVHIVQDSFSNLGVTQAQLVENVDTLNEMFSPICASFEICEFNIIDKFRFDTLAIDTDPEEFYEMDVLYHRDNRINVYVVSTIEDPDHPSGRAYENIASLTSGGIVIGKSFISPLGKVLAHEMGHFFGLQHTFVGEMRTDELVSGANSLTTADNLTDTPADPYIYGTDAVSYVNVDLGCRFINQERDANNEFYIPDVGNIMSYYQEECLCGFTYQQYQLMAQTYLDSSPRMW